MPELVHEYRGGLLENIHCGRITVVDGGGNLLYSVGDPDTPTYFRSSSKPLQTLPVIMHGLDERYGLSEEELVLMSGSHAGEDFHLNAIVSMLEKNGFSESDMIMLPVYPAERGARRRMMEEKQPPRKALHNCAGKHVAAMMLQRHLTGDHRAYWQPDSAAQKEIAHWIGKLAEWPPEDMWWGTDGCGVPVFAVPQKNIAIAYLNLACPDRVSDPQLRRAVEKLAPLIHRHNRMMRGTGYLCSVINEDDNIVAKGGAKGVYGMGLKKERLGVSLKIEDGTEQCWPAVLASVLEQLEYDGVDTIAALRDLAPEKILNDNNTEVGEHRMVFELTRNSCNAK